MAPVMKFLFFSFTYTSGLLFTTFFCALFYARHDFITPNLILSGINILLILFFPVVHLLGSPLWIREQFLNFYFLAFLVQGLLLAVVFLWKSHSINRITLPGKPELRKLFHYSVYALLANVVFFLLYRIDYWFVRNICSVCKEGDLGNYIQVSKVGQIFLIVPAIIASAIFPRTAAGFREQVNSSMQVVSRFVFFTYLLVVLLLVFIGKRLFPFVYGDTFRDMYLPFLWLSPGILSLSVLAFLSAYNAGKDRVMINLVGALLALVVIVIGDILLIPRYGIIAAAMVSSLGYLSNLVYALYHFKKEYNSNLASFFIPGRSDVDRIKTIFLASKD